MTDYRANAEHYRWAADQWADRRGYEQFQQWLKTGRTLEDAMNEISAEMVRLHLAMLHIEYLIAAQIKEERHAVNKDEHR